MCDGVLKLLVDANSEVQNLAVKWFVHVLRACHRGSFRHSVVLCDMCSLGVVVRKGVDDSVKNVTTFVLGKLGDAEEQTRDIAGLGRMCAHDVFAVLETDCSPPRLLSQVL